MKQYENTGVHHTYNYRLLLLMESSNNNVSSTPFSLQDMRHEEKTNLPFLVDNRDSILQLHIIEEGLEEDVSHPNETVVFLLIIERISTLEVRPYHL